MIAEKCVNITGYGPNFSLQGGIDYITILTHTSSYRYSGINSPRGMDSTTAPLIGLKSEKFMSISFYR